MKIRIRIRNLLPSLRQCIFLALGIFALLQTGGVLNKIQEQREQYRLTENRPLENAPPELVMATTALGGFRGLIIDYLWLRATELRSKGSHYEIVQIYDWIGKLEPRIPDVWSFTAHEMVYNICVTMPTAEERWRWILRGIEHIRDFGLFYNQNSPKLYWHLGLIFWDKVGLNPVDEHAFYYRKQWAEMMEEVLGETPNLRELAEFSQAVPSFLDEPEIQSLLIAAKAIDIDLPQEFFGMKNLPQPKQASLQNLLKESHHKAAFQKLSAYLRARRLRLEFKMDPKKMLALENQYHHVDFRLTFNHALYWAEEGIQIVASQPALKESVISRNLDRLKYAALQQNFEYGRVVSKGERGLVCIPNFEVLQPLHELFEAMQNKWGEEKGLLSHEVFLREVVWNCYLYNRRKEAQKYYQILARKFARADYQQDLDSYATQQIGNQVKFIGRRLEVENYIVGILVLSCHALRVEPEQHQGLLDFANILYREYVKRHGDLDSVNPLEQPRPFSYFQKTAVVLFQEQLQKELGTVDGKIFFDRLAQQFPFLAELAK
jgi:hypothetical protein